MSNIYISITISIGREGLRCVGSYIYIYIHIYIYRCCISYILLHSYSAIYIHYMSYNLPIYIYIIIKMHAFPKAFHTIWVPQWGVMGAPQILVPIVPGSAPQCRRYVFQYVLHGVRFRTMICITF